MPAHYAGVDPKHDFKGQSWGVTLAEILGNLEAGTAPTGIHRNTWGSIGIPHSKGFHV